VTSGTPGLTAIPGIEEARVREILILNRIPGIGVRRLRALVSHFGDPLAVRTAGAYEVSRVPGFSRGLALAVAQFLRSASLAAVEQEVADDLASLRESGAGVLHLWNPAYPRRLAAVYDAPPILFVRGSFAHLSGSCVAVVGTRRPTPYGLASAEHFARELCAAGAVVVSGLARGIDTRAHRAALDAEGTTIAVVGTSTDLCYPRENHRLAEDIAATGAIVSEYPPGTGPEPANFPRRNRIISGLSLGTLVVESDTDGGAMITAYLALDQDREVFAVPGSILSSRSRGCHALIRDGKARLASTVDDVISELGPELGPAAGTRGAQVGAPGDPVAGGRRRPTLTGPATLSEREKAVAGLLGAEPLHIDDLAGASDLPVPDLLVTLLTLEMHDVVRQLPGKYFVLRF
jgi:DNA processing protein